MLEEEIYEFIDKNPGSTGLSHEHKYVLVGDCSMKDSALGWVEAVIYYEVNHPERPFIRNKENFFKKFKKSDPEDDPGTYEQGEAEEE
jgi:hypothetical protein